MNKIDTSKLMCNLPDSLDRQEFEEMLARKASLYSANITVDYEKKYCLVRIAGSEKAEEIIEGIGEALGRWGGRAEVMPDSAPHSNRPRMR